MRINIFEACVSVTYLVGQVATKINADFVIACFSVCVTIHVTMRDSVCAESTRRRRCKPLSPVAARALRLQETRKEVKPVGACALSRGEGK